MQTKRNALHVFLFALAAKEEASTCAIGLRLASANFLLFLATVPILALLAISGTARDYLSAIAHTVNPKEFILSGFYTAVLVASTFAAILVFGPFSIWYGIALNTERPSLRRWDACRVAALGQLPLVLIFAACVCGYYSYPFRYYGRWIGFVPQLALGFTSCEAALVSWLSILPMGIRSRPTGSGGPS